jgi:hypothetical protein
MMQDIPLEEYKWAYRQVAISAAKRTLVTHVTFFVMVNVILTVINLLFTPDVYWFPFPVLIWGTALAVHFLDVRWKGQTLMEREAKAEYYTRQSKSR